MNSKHFDFETTAHAKWILAGEHAVLRGNPALVFPIPGKCVKLSFRQKENQLEADFTAPFGETLLLFFWGVLDTGLKMVDKNQSDVNGYFFLENNIPMGAGMGFSAAFCVVVARWFVWRGWLLESELFNFARNLENNFHGKSSGVDIAGAISDHGMYFKMGQQPQPLQVKWKPKLYLSYSDQIGVTAKCVQTVNTLWSEDSSLAKRLDHDMTESVLSAEQALALNENLGLPLLKQAIDKANDCFHQWGLVDGNLELHTQLLREAGALAVKPTGAGGGGYVLSLWKQTPRDDLPFEFIPVF